MRRDARIYIAGHRGLVGSGIRRKLETLGFENLILPDRDELDLTRQSAVERFFAATRPDYVFVAAARVGGIHANLTHPADFIADNLKIQTNVIDAARRSGVEKLLFLGSSCIYPRDAPQPIREASMLTGALEPTNEWYAIAKIAGIKMCQAYRRQYGFNAICAVPSNLYGPGDNFDLETAHVVPALIRKSHEALQRGQAELAVWGTGAPRRELLHVDDLADALVLLMESYEDEQIINVGTGDDIAIRDLAQLVCEVVGFTGQLRFDASRPDGTPGKVLDVSRINALGWTPSIGIRDGIASTYAWFSDHERELRQ